ncbi:MULTISPECIES: glycosyltransferase family 39 protein [unclassified Dolichospermum]|uniref:Putative membrane protein n=1 Tax=Anabaena sp. Syke748 TaxID=1497395 RepID=A0A024BSG8_9NOST|nr:MULTISPECIES: glycosyltransferase family 39 protein [unclassified Dolichospermum]AHZ20765.1 putative membrane protein [Anabaena sp. Syke748]MTJ19608.1 dolichyl-phosphate-mannose--protein mannosyltransferase [Dolichospermum sp. UHCC 0299]MTJ39262.1 dolichyl-phosphate-mannose--protein mannosyltransferase [Dolichospermum sp. UHCC 0406]
MNQSQLLTKTNPPSWLKILVIIFMGLSIFCRFTNLGQKIYSSDENWTSVAISGHTLNELKQEVSQNQGIIPISNFDKYQHINLDRGVADTVNYLITSDPQHPPLYYVMVRLWAQVFGDSPAGVRSLSAIISLLIFPTVYWLCLELFDSAVVGWIAMALIAVSPLQLYFAQEARQYTLWMVEILGSSAALLRAMKQENKINWALYSLSLVLGLYTHLFTFLIMISHGIYVIIQQQFHFTKTFINYLISTIAAFLIFLPWLLVFITHLQTALALTSGFGIKYINNPFELIAIFLDRVTRIFFDLNFTTSIILARFTDEGSLYYSITSLILSLILIIYSLFLLVRNYQNKAYLFIFLLGGFPSLLLMVYDITSGGSRSLQVRYQLPLYLCLEITVAYLLSFAFQILQEQLWRRKIAQLLMVLFLLAGLVSDVTFFQARSWWTQSSSRLIIQTIQTMNKSESPLLVINNAPINLGGILALSHYSPKVPLLPVADNEIMQIPENYHQIFFIQNNSRSFHQMEQDEKYAEKAIIVLDIPPGGLWEFEKGQQS